MWTDLILVAVLSAAGIIGHHLSSRSRTLRVSLSPSRALAALRSFRKHPFGIVTLAWLVGPTAGWVVILSTSDPAELLATLGGVSATDRCHRVAERVFEQESSQSFTMDAIGAATRQWSIRSHFPRPDGYGGTLVIDEEGFLTCSLHGRPPALSEPLLPSSSVRGRPSAPRFLERAR